MSDKFIPCVDIKIFHDFIVSIGIVLGLLLGRSSGVMDTMMLEVLVGYVYIERRKK
ncbi:MAG: hypothetical protein EMLJLAPB_00574 [Candidatus Argoarchaeum ethanivorans]|uniref:Uncharacterized protein n=1 Tax=Candidatus Argoarchaeum ethanivorans TaxID=2608793 RepID=A0A811T8I8_9EURY|nr:MAG: hypothetical protein EMLJLAPB_00574 [Candidatus Argoarchaeum ethanivorans]